MIMKNNFSKKFKIMSRDDLKFVNFVIQVISLNMDSKKQKEEITNNSNV